jgi:tRNA pseudouridine13 synthase
LSAVQSALFNHYLGRRLSEGLFRRILQGDVMAKLPHGGLFVAEDLTREQERFDGREIVSTGPIFGRKMFAAAAAAAEREAEVLADFELTLASFEGFGTLLAGTRRHNLVYVTDLSAAMSDEGLRLTFTLPAGCYATVLLREVMKANVPGTETD